MVANGIVVHNSQRDGHVRESHAAIDGDVVAIGQPFANGLRFPGDDGPVEELVNCRCDTLPQIPGAARSADYRDAQWRIFNARLTADGRRLERQFKRLVEEQRKRVLGKLEARG